MAKRCALLFAMFGYFLVVWYYWTYFAPVNWVFGRDLLWHMCLSCPSVTGVVSGRLELALLLFGPINCLIYAMIGLLFGKCVYSGTGQKSKA